MRRRRLQWFGRFVPLLLIGLSTATLPEASAQTSTPTNTPDISCIGEIDVTDLFGSPPQDDTFNFRSDVYLSGLDFMPGQRVYYKVTDVSGSVDLSPVRTFIVPNTGRFRIPLSPFSVDPDGNYRVIVSNDPSFPSGSCTKSDNFKVLAETGPTPTPTPSDTCTQLEASIFTTDANGENNNLNQYESQEAVWLNGGPESAGCAIPGQTLYYQVFTPDGQTALSPVRTLIVPGDCTFRAPLAYFNFSPNNGDEYKVLVSTSPTFPEGSCTKSDNFKLRPELQQGGTPSPTPSAPTSTPTATITGTIPSPTPSLSPTPTRTRLATFTPTPTVTGTPPSPTPTGAPAPPLCERQDGCFLWELLEVDFVSRPGEATFAWRLTNFCELPLQRVDFRFVPSAIVSDRTEGSLYVSPSGFVYSVDLVGGPHGGIAFVAGGQGGIGTNESDIFTFSVFTQELSPDTVLWNSAVTVFGMTTGRIDIRSGLCYSFPPFLAIHNASATYRTSDKGEWEVTIRWSVLSSSPSQSFDLFRVTPGESVPVHINSKPLRPDGSGWIRFVDIVSDGTAEGYLIQPLDDLGRGVGPAVHVPLGSSLLVPVLTSIGGLVLLAMAGLCAALILHRRRHQLAARRN